MKSGKILRGANGCWKRDSDSLQGVRGEKFKHKNGNFIGVITETSRGFRACVVESKDKSFLKNSSCSTKKTKIEAEKELNKLMKEYC